MLVNTSNKSRSDRMYVATIPQCEQLERHFCAKIMLKFTQAIIHDRSLSPSACFFMISEQSGDNGALTYGFCVFIFFILKRRASKNLIESF